MRERRRVHGQASRTFVRHRPLKFGPSEVDVVGVDPLLLELLLDFA